MNHSQQQTLKTDVNMHSTVASFDWENPQYAPIFSARQKLLFKLRKNPKLLKAYKKIYKNDPVRFIEDWMCTYDPRRKPSNMPFILFPKQREFIYWLKDKYEKQEPGLVEKSRDMGLTWLCCAFAIWLWLFEDGSKAGFGSRKQDLVDKLGDMDSIFEKMRYLLRDIPDLFLPDDYSESEHANFLKFRNPENSSSITGESGDNIGRGGRNGIYFKDESAFYDRPEKIEASLSQNADCKIDVSTPNGIGNPFYEKRHGGVIDVFTFHWRDDPRKDTAWYEKQKTLLDALIVAQEIDIDYSASATMICIPASWVLASREIQEYIKIDKESGVRVAGLDIGGDGDDQTVYVPRFGPVVGKSIAWDDGDTIDSANEAKDLYLRDGMKKLNYDNIGVGHGMTAQFKRFRKTDKVKAQGVNVGLTPTDAYWPDGKTSKEKFNKLKAELWWIVRDRFQKTYNTYLNLITKGKEGKLYPYEDLIFLPDDNKLKSQISVVKYERTASGKIQIESKKKLATRGIKSPDRADALMLAFCPDLTPTPTIRRL